MKSYFNHECKLSPKSEISIIRDPLTLKSYHLQLLAFKTLLPLNQLKYSNIVIYSKRVVKSNTSQNSQASYWTVAPCNKAETVKHALTDCDR